MNFSLLARKYRSAIIQSRTSPISRVAILLTFSLAAIALIISVATKLIFLDLPNIMPLVLGVIVLDVLSQFTPQTKIVRAVRPYSTVYYIW
jgi:hypothetical protein